MSMQAGHGLDNTDDDDSPQIKRKAKVIRRRKVLLDSDDDDAVEATVQAASAKGSHRRISVDSDDTDSDALSEHGLDELTSAMGEMKPFQQAEVDSEPDAVLDADSDCAAEEDSPVANRCRFTLVD